MNRSVEGKVQGKFRSEDIENVFQYNVRIKKQKQTEPETEQTDSVGALLVASEATRPLDDVLHRALLHGALLLDRLDCSEKSSRS